MKILVADDVPVNLMLISKHLKRSGHEIIEATNGSEAVEKYFTEHPDIILLDIMMPVMNGYEAAEKIKAQTDRPWVPIIFLSALSSEADQVKGLAAGADDYVTKPINLDVLDAKMMAMLRISEIQQQLAETTRQLQHYHHESEIEQATAHALMERMINKDRLNDEMLQHWELPAKRFSGDMVAATRSEDGRLYILHADSTGHGLTAALPLFTISQLFYEMAGNGLPISMIVQLMNSRIHALMPADRFVAVAMVMVDQVGGVVEIWNGGCPAILLTDAAGQVVKHFPSQSTAPGVTQTSAFSNKTSLIDYPENGHMVMYSDGLTEAMNADGKPFGEQGIIKALVGAGGQDAFAAIIDAMSLHLDAEVAHDDISIIMLNYKT